MAALVDLLLQTACGTEGQSCLLLLSILLPNLRRSCSSASLWSLKARCSSMLVFRISRVLQYNRVCSSLSLHKILFHVFCHAPLLCHQVTPSRSTAPRTF